MNTTSNITYALNNYYSRVMLERGLPVLLHSMFANIKDIPKGNTNVMKFRRYGALALATTPLTEGTTPAGKSLSVTDVTVTVSQYGDYVTITDWVDMTSTDPVLTETAEVLGEQAGQTLDAIIRDVLAAGTNAQYADATTPASNTLSNQIAATDKITKAEVMIAVRTLKNANAKPITRMVSSNPGQTTVPVKASYVAIVHPNTTYDLKGISEFVTVEKYADRATDLMPGEVGKLDEVRFIESTQAKVKTGAGASTIDVYATLIFGQNAYGVTRISGESLRNIRKALGSAGTADPLEQRMTSGWKATLAAVVLNQTFMLRLEHAVS